MSNKAERQLKELRRLMPWTWDARVEKHPPGEKALKDFENVLSFQDQPRTRKIGSATKTDGPGTSSTNNASTGRHEVEPTPHSKRKNHSASVQHLHGKPSAERRSHSKRPSLGQPSLCDDAGRDGTAARLVGDASARAFWPFAEAEEELVEATPAVHRSHHAGSRLAPPDSGTPAAPGAQTPGSGLQLSSAPLSALASCPHQAALTGGQFRPTPATAAAAVAPLPQSSGKPSTCKMAGGEAYHPLRRQLLQSSTKLAPTEAAVVAAAAARRGGGASTPEKEGGPEEGQQVQAESGNRRSPESHSGVGKHPRTAAVLTTPIVAASPGVAVAAGYEAGEAAEGPCPMDVSVGGPQPSARQCAAGGLEQGLVAAPAAAAVVTPHAAILPQQQEEEAQQGTSPKEDGLAAMELDGTSCRGAMSPPVADCGPAPLPTPAPLQPALLPPPEGLPAPSPTTAMPGTQEPGTALALAPVAVGATARTAAEPPRAMERCPSGVLPPLVLAGLEMVTPSQGPLPPPPVLTTLQPLAPLQPQQQAQQRQQQQLVVPEAAGDGEPVKRTASLEFHPHPTWSNAEAAAAPAHLVAAAECNATVGPSTQPRGGKPVLLAELAAAVGARKPPRHRPVRAAALEVRRASTGTLPVRQATVLTALSQLPAGAGLGPGPAQEALPAAPALPLFQTGSLHALPVTDLRRTQSDADLHSLLIALPTTPRAAAAAAAPASAPAQGACPPLFKQGGGKGDQDLAAAGLPPVGTEQEREQQGEEAGAAAGEDVEMADAGQEAAAAGEVGAALAERGAPHSKGIAACAALLADKENLCGNNAGPAGAPLSLAPRQPWRAPCGTAKIQPAANASAVAAATAGLGEPSPPTRYADEERWAVRAALRDTQGISVPAAAAVVPPRCPPSPPVQLSAWKLQQLSAASRLQHTRERKLLRAIAGGRVPPAPGGASPEEAAAVDGAMRSPPQAAMSPPPRPQPGKNRAGGGAPGGSGGRAEGRLAAASGRVGRAGAGHSLAGGPGRRGREIVMGATLARACTQLLKERLSDWGPLPSAPCIH